MGRQKGLVHLTGQFGDVQLYISADGVPLARFVRPVSGKKVKRDANYALTRKNNDEFTGSVFVARSLRQCLGDRIKQFADRKLSPRLMALSYSVLAKGPGMAGERSFEVAPHVGAFRRLDADRNEPLTGRFQAPFTTTVNPDRNTATLDVPAFTTNNYLRCPQGATHFRLLLVAGVLSDHVYTGGNPVYVAVNPEMNGVSVVAESAVMPAVNAVNAALQLVAAVPGLPVLPSSASLVVSVGVEFLRVINAFEQEMASGNALRVVEVF
jgi:hypothetical protein